MKRIRPLRRDSRASAAAEMALVAPMLIAVMVGSLELGNFFLDEHALTKQVRDGARFASRLALSEDYVCPSEIYAAGDAISQITNVTKTGAVSGAGNPRWTDYWTRNCDGEGQTVEVSFRCVSKDNIDTDDTGHTGIYSSLVGEIPVVSVSGAVKYRSVLGTLGFDATNICLRAASEVAVAGS